MKKTFQFLLFSSALAFSAEAQNLSGKLIFSLPGATPGGDSVCSINPDGTGFSFITHGSYPRLSPDGKMIAYLFGSAATRTLQDIYFRNAAGQTYQFYDNSSGYPTLNYDFTASSAYFVFDWQNMFYRMAADDPNGQSVYLGSGRGDLSDEYPRVNPVDSSVVSHNPNTGLYITPQDGSGSVFVPNTQGGDRSPVWSHNGQWIYFARQYGANPYNMHNIYRIKPDGTGLTQITNLPATDTLGMSLVLTKNEQWIVATARVNGVIGLYEFAVNPASPATTGFAIKTFPYLRSLADFWLGNADTVKDFSGTASVKSLDKKIGEVYPNPVINGIINIHLQQPVERFAIYNATMQLIASEEMLSAGNHRIQLPASAAPGMYYLQGFTKGEKWTCKLMVE